MSRRKRPWHRAKDRCRSVADAVGEVAEPESPAKTKDERELMIEQAEKSPDLLEKLRVLMEKYRPKEFKSRHHEYFWLQYLSTVVSKDPLDRHVILSSLNGAAALLIGLSVSELGNLPGLGSHASCLERKLDDPCKLCQPVHWAMARSGVSADGVVQKAMDQADGLAERIRENYWQFRGILKDLDTKEEPNDG